MTSTRKHGRTQSVFHSTFSAVGLSPHHNVRSDFTLTTPQACHDYNAWFDPTELQIATPPRVASPSRPGLGSRLLSSISNAQPATASLSRKGSVLHSRAKSLAAVLPKLNSSSSSLSEKAHSANRIIGDLFTGESAPIRLGAPVSPTKEKQESDFVMEYRPQLTERPSGMLRRAQTIPMEPPKTPTETKSASSWLSRKPKKATPMPQHPQDEFVNLDINTALFPNGPADPLSPSSFNDLLLMASSLLLRMQVAYKEKVDYIASIRPELDAQQDETEGAEIKATLLKKQLEDMSRRAEEQEKTMMEMARELADEKIKSHDAQQALEAAKTIRVVPNSKDEHHSGPMRLRRRSSNDNASDSGFESDIESIFSSQSVPGTPLSAPDISLMPSLELRVESVRQANERDIGTVKKRPSAISTNGNGQRLGREGAAWATVDVLRTENRELKNQIQQMEETLQGCIDLIGAVGAT